MNHSAYYQFYNSPVNHYSGDRHLHSVVWCGPVFSWLCMYVSTCPGITDASNLRYSKKQSRRFTLPRIASKEIVFLAAKNSFLLLHSTSHFSYETEDGFE